MPLPDLEKSKPTIRRRVKLHATAIRAVPTPSDFRPNGERKLPPPPSYLGLEAAVAVVVAAGQQIQCGAVLYITVQNGGAKSIQVVL